MIKTYRCPLGVEDATKTVLFKQSELANKLWNLLIKEVNYEFEYYKTNKKNDKFCPFSKFDLRNKAVSLKIEHPVLKYLYSTCFQHVALKMREALKLGQFCKYRSLKQKGFFTLTYEGFQGWKIKDNQLILSQGKIKIENKRKRSSITVKLTRKLPFLHKDIKIIEIIYNKKEKRFFAHFSYFVPDLNKVQIKNMIAFDPNHKTLLVGYDSEGKTHEFFNYSLIKYTQEQINKVKKIKDNLKHKKSIQWKFYNNVIIKLYKKKSKQIQGFCNTIANYLCKNYDMIAVGDYVPFDSKIKQINKVTINESFFGQLRQSLARCSQRSGKYYFRAPEEYTTKRCSSCDTIGESLSPKIREWTCKFCGDFHLRDENAAKNIFRLAENHIKEMNWQLAADSCMPRQGYLSILERYTYRFFNGKFSIKEKRVSESCRETFKNVDKKLTTT